MKKLTIAAIALTTAAGVFAQGTVNFNNRNSLGTSHIYAPLASSGTGASFSQIGNGTADNVAGTTSWAGFTGIGAAGLGGLYGGTTTLAQLLGANGSNQSEQSLTPQSITETFRTGAAAAGFLNIGPAVTTTSIPLDSAVATFEVVAWDDSTGLFSTWSLASVAWNAGLIAAGKSGTFNTLAIGGNVNTPQSLAFPSFNLYFNIIPEPSSFALAGLGAAAMLIFRRRK